MYQKLDPHEIISTAEALHGRITERFPHAGLSRVCAEVVDATKKAAAVATGLNRPHWGFRLTMATVGLVTFVSLVGGLAQAKVRAEFGTISDYIQGIQALAQIIVYAGASAYFLSSLETRRKRSLVLKALHTLRSMAHVVDMHQLTKTPEVLHTGGEGPSPKRSLTSFELKLYLDFCTEILSVIGKIAATYTQEFHDSAAVDAASDVENLTVALSRQIWQKISLLKDFRHVTVDPPELDPDLETG